MLTIIFFFLYFVVKDNIMKNKDLINVSTHITKELYEKFKAHAKEQERSKSYLIKKYIEQDVASKEIDDFTAKMEERMEKNKNILTRLAKKETDFNFEKEMKDCMEKNKNILKRLADK